MVTDLRGLALHTLLVRLEEAPTPTARRELCKTTAAQLGISERQLYRHLQALRPSERKPRADKGKSGLTVEALTGTSQVMAAGRNKRGQPNIPTTEAHRIAQESDTAVGKYSYGHVARRLREEGLSMQHLRAGEAAQVRRSLHPNHVWFFDISVAIQWFFRDESGKYLDQYDDAGARFYEGKIENYKAVRKVIRRYAVTDHTTGCYYVQYFYGTGELSVDVVDFLHRAMSPKAGLELAFPFRGIPRRLVMDQGSANKAALTRNLLRELGVQVQYHAPGNAKASGSVETRHNHWQRSFEGRLRLQPVNDLEALNTLAAQFCAKATAERLHSRHGRPPLDTWRSITTEQLVEAPPRDIFFQLASRATRPATLNEHLILRADKQAWQVEGAGVHPGQKVVFRRCIHDEQGPGIRVWDAFGRELAASALSKDAWGQWANARGHTWDDAEDPGATHPRTPAQQIMHEVADKTIEPRLPVFDDLAAQMERQVFLPVQGTAWTPREDSIMAAAPLISESDVRGRVADELDRALTPEEATWWRERAAGGVTAERYAELLTTFLSGESAAPGLVALSS